MTDDRALPVEDHGHAEWDELAAGAALYALEPDEQRRFDAHLITCARCQEELREHEVVAAQLGSLSAGSDTAPPPWSSIRSRLGSAPRDDLTAAGEQPAITDALPIRNEWQWRSRRVLASAAAVVALAAVGVTVWQLDPGSRPREIATCAGIAGCHDVRIVDASGVHIGDIVVSGSSATVRPAGMPPARPGKSYVLWQIHGSAPPAAVAAFAGNQPATVPLKLPYAATTAFAISEETSGSVPAAPTDILWTARVPT